MLYCCPRHIHNFKYNIPHHCQKDSVFIKMNCVSLPYAYMNYTTYWPSSGRGERPYFQWFGEGNHHLKTGTLQEWATTDRAGLSGLWEIDFLTRRNGNPAAIEHTYT
jgi:hypothetical protein